MSAAFTKPVGRVLERVWEAEICGRPCQANESAALKRALDEGLVERVTLTLEGRFPVTVKAVALTHLGRLLYCASCSEDEETRG